MSHQSLLWSLRSAAGKSSWLFGTMHIKDNRAYQLCNQLYPLILQSDGYIGEMDLSRNTMSYDLLPYDINQYLKTEAFLKLEHQLKKSFGINLNQWAHVHPLMIMSVISNSVLQSEHHISLDEHLWKFAEEHGKKTSGLESHDEQLTILHSIDPKPIYKQLLNISRNPGSIRKNTDRSLKLYMSGRIHELYLLSKSSMQHLRKKVIYERNRKMAAVIDQLDQDSQYFITVGAAHLSGKYGLITMLKKKGYLLKAVKLISILKAN